MYSGTVSVNYQGDTAIIVMKGDVDMAIADRLDELVDVAVDRSHSIIFDLSQAEFVGVTAADAFVRAFSGFGERKGCVLIRAATPMTLYILRATELIDLFSFDSERQSAGNSGAAPTRERSRRSLRPSKRQKCDHWSRRGGWPPCPT